MEKLILLFGGAAMAIILMFFIAVGGGTILWSIYPHIHALFPSAASNGIIATDLHWWDSVCIVWIFGLLLKGSSSSSSTKD